ncbi:hypothetical protein LPJ61_001314 [Coemansia biformis]|uniref:Ribosome recycling factor domain-containing protein n=1 Tax=Coemansia biformis TaxID=1286918 RepID=A0A9W7YFF0_9FUNG|nr:hypothetical protein LPJ61_001314 [Coemansia biformis]
MALRNLSAARLGRLCRPARMATFAAWQPAPAAPPPAQLRPHPAMLRLALAGRQQLCAYGSKRKGGKKGGSQRSDEQEDAGGSAGADPVDMERMEKRMAGRVERLASELQAMRAGRASPGMLDHVRVQLKGGSALLPELALVAVKDAQHLLVVPNNPEEQSAIETSIRNAELGLNPRADKGAVVVPVPKTTKESRDRLVKSLGALAEQTRVHVRKDRQDAMKQLKAADKAGGMATDAVRAWERDIQAATDRHAARIEELVKAKTREIERA